MPIEGERLVIEPKFPNADILSRMGKDDESEPLPEGLSERNCWWSARQRCYIVVWNDSGKILWGQVPGFNSLKHAMRTLSCADAWGIEQEGNAVQLLGTMVRHRQLKQYLLTGMFVETSKRSGITYVFRKLRPTIAMKPDGDGMRILAALCLHPIAYYQDSWAGAMTPSDDVAAHLAMMRGDEHLFWKRSNQHRPDRPEAGL